MNQLLFYLLQVIAASGLLYCYYHFALRNKKFNRYNRFYLLIAIVISTLIPFLNIPVYFSENETRSSAVLQTLQVISSPAAEETISPVLQTEPVTSSWFNAGRLVFLFYFLAILCFLIRVFTSLNKIRYIIKRNPAEQIDKVKFINTDEPGTPFSFFRWLFWNKKIELHSEKGEQIFRHELFHIQQKHSWDIIFMELISTIFWINPFFHLIKKELKAIHEFLADEFAIRENRNWQYAELLLMQVLNTNNHLVNPFFHNQIKRRIAMITTSKKPSYQYLRKLMVLPVAAIILLLFAFNYQNKKINSERKDGIIETGTKENSKKAVDSVLITDKIESIKTGFFKGAPTLPEFRSWSNPKMFKVFLDQKKIDNAKLSNYSPADFTLYSVGIPSNDGVKYHKKFYCVNLFTKKYYQGNTELKNALGRLVEDQVILTDTTKKPQPLLVINGKPMPGITSKDLNKIDPNDIESMSILKGDTAMNKYGDDARNGVIEIITKHKIDDISINEILKSQKDTIKPNDPDNIVFVKVEVPPTFPGGEKEWRKYLEKNLDPEIAKQYDCKSGTFTVVIQFIIKSDGTISGVRPKSKNGFGLEEHVADLIQKGTKWLPAIQNGHKVSAYLTQPVTFIIGDGNPDNSKSVKYSNEPGLLNEIVVTSAGK